MRIFFMAPLLFACNLEVSYEPDPSLADAEKINHVSCKYNEGCFLWVETDAYNLSGALFNNEGNLNKLTLFTNVYDEKAHDLIDRLDIMHADNVNDTVTEEIVRSMLLKEVVWISKGEHSVVLKQGEQSINIDQLYLERAQNVAVATYNIHTRMFGSKNDVSADYTETLGLIELAKGKFVSHEMEVVNELGDREEPLPTFIFDMDLLEGVTPGDIKMGVRMSWEVEGKLNPYVAGRVIRETIPRSVQYAVKPVRDYFAGLNEDEKAGWTPQIGFSYSGDGKMLKSGSLWERKNVSNHLSTFRVNNYSMYEHWYFGRNAKGLLNSFLTLNELSRTRYVELLNMPD